jgi:nicotinate-nucleotide adenylyltransferase
LEWLKTIFKNVANVHVSDFEVQQQRQVPTYESVVALQQHYDKIYVTIGADNLASLHKWYRYEELKKLVTFIVISRPGFSKKGWENTIDLHVDISSTQLRKSLQEEFLPPQVAKEIITYYKENNENAYR